MTQTLRAPTSTDQQAQQPAYVVSDDDRKRQQRIAHAWDAYNGDLPPPLKQLDGQPDDNTMSNRCQPIIDRGVDFLFGNEIEISVEEGAPAEAQDTLDATWGRKEARIPLLQRVAMNGAMAGRAFLRIVPGKNGIRLVGVDPSIVFVQTAPQDCETVLLYCIEYASAGMKDGHPVKVMFREEIARIDPSSADDTNGYADTNPDGIDPAVTWEIQHWSRIGERGPWTPAGPPISWLYPFPPLFSCQNLPRPNDFWGTPDLTPDLIAVNNSLNLVQSCVNRILKLYGSPILYATGTGEQVIDIRPGKIIGLPLTESKIVAVALASDVANALAFAENLRSDIDEQSSTPGVATGRISTMPRGNLSGIAIELLFMPLLKRTDKKRCLYGEMLIDVSKAIIALSHMSGDIDITIAWESPIPHDDLPAVQAAIAKLELSVSKTTLQRELGYSPEDEMKIKQSEDEMAIANAQASMEQAGLPPALPGTKPLPGQVPAAPAPAQPPVPQESPFMGGH